MKNIVFLFALAAIITSCKSYQLNTVSSLNTQKNDATGVFNRVNDSVSISYNFSGENSPVSVEVFNKLNEPLYINWERSALIIDDKAYSFVDDNLKVTGETYSSTFDLGRNYFNSTTGTINANIKLSKNESFLPPHSKTSRTIFVIDKIGVNQIDKSLFKKEMLNDADGINQVYTKTASFSPENSPLKFKSYITLYTLKDNQPQPFSYQNDFFISNVTKMGQDPDNTNEYGSFPGNVMITSKTTGFAKTMTVVAVAGVVGGAAALNNNVKEKSNK